MKKFRKNPIFLAAQETAVEAILMAPAEEYSCLPLKRTMNSLVAIHAKYKKVCIELGLKSKHIRLTWRMCLNKAVKYDLACH